MATLPLSYPMSGGDGPHSYVRNSSYQKAAIDSVKEKTKEAISKILDFHNQPFKGEVFRVADFGCSFGQNTFDVVGNIIQTVELKHKQEKTEEEKIKNPKKELEFHVFFNDQPNNDFNTLFKTLPLLLSTRRCFAYGVPSSFYGRVLPRNSIHIGHTSYTLHWLSKAPEDVGDRNSPAWNKDSIQCTSLVGEASNAYRVQFKRDMADFIEARAEELVPGGLMIISGQCLPDDVSMVSTWKGVVIDMIGDCLFDMAKSGVTREEMVESFNLPIYFPNTSELEEVIEQNGCFRIEIMEEVKHPMEDETLSNDFIVSKFRAIFHGVIEEHFGGGLIDELFGRFAKKLTSYPVDFKKCRKDMQYFIVLKRYVF
ncbi:PREDICTED: probable S-adenosylmethionine-dependent methyltransferase At5g37990 [Tarenaya hassleriana]|uniref:probable S-adenosylmethionine-dependent methyltransferase At5g37990 n=1 Tax=Tarenaya hassleriana TaxID=28532 RepID=UPI00053C4577|nr:PREDICTED: probable S-adenosylmethionine-dependent methyltransferase At5g37990 [Tarenaya hassleriana]